MGTYNPSLARIIASFKKIRVDYYIKDETISDGGLFEKYWEEQGAKKAELNDKFLCKVNMIFVCGYTKIIKSDLLNKYIFVNIHAGNLPKWRGTSANSWAIINGEYNIAYSLHRVTDILDGGAVYCKYEYHLKENEKYGDGRTKIEQMLETSLESSFIEICSGKNTGIEQSGKYVYCCSFKKKDGIIKDWNIETNKLIDLFRVFGQPYGSGLCFVYKQNQYEIMDICRDEAYMNYDCIPGAIVNKNDAFIWVKTKDSVVKIGEIKKVSGEILPAPKIFGIGIRLG